MLYRYLAPKSSNQQLVTKKSLALPFGRLTRGNGTTVADLNGDILVIGGYNSSTFRTYIQYLRIEPDGSDMTFVNSISVSNTKQQPAPSATYYPRGFELRTDALGDDVRMWTVTAVTNNASYNTNGIHKYKILNGTLNSQIFDNTIANNYPNYLHTSSWISQSKTYYSKLRLSANGAYYSVVGGVPSVTNLQTSHDPLYGSAVYLVHELPTPGHVLICYFKTGAPNNRAFDIWVNGIRTYIEVDLPSDSFAPGHWRAIKNVGNTVCVHQPPLATSYVYNGAGVFQPQSSVGIVGQGGITFPAELPDGRILLLGAFASKDTLTYSEASGWALSKDKVSTPSTTWAHAHRSGAVITIDAANNVNLHSVE